ncbi:MAG: hypothetical protein QM781_15050 [Chitinophagaceae bacterium]
MKTLITIMTLFVVSCNTTSKEAAACPDFVKERTEREAVLFFHRPISGSTYQLFLFPVYDIAKDGIQDSLVLNKQVTAGVSFSVASDDKQFSDILRTAKNIELVDHDSLAPNYRNIYYSYIRVNILSDLQELKKDKELSQKKLTLMSGTEISLKYYFIPFFELEVLESKK